MPVQVIEIDSGWQFSKASENEWLEATVPGCVHTDLLNAGRIDDPFYRDNEEKLMWIGETDWVYAVDFDTAHDFLEHDRVLLRFEGLDTLAAVTLNDTPLGQTDNMFRTWEFNVAGILTAGRNRLAVHFTAPGPYARAKQEREFLQHGGIGHHRLNGCNRIRKEQCNFGWDWGPMCLTSGIWRPVHLVGFSDARISQVFTDQMHRERKVQLGVCVEAEKVSAGALAAEVALEFEGQTVAETTDRKSVV